jgi:hypothetical protein
LRRGVFLLLRTCFSVHAAATTKIKKLGWGSFAAKTSSTTLLPMGEGREPSLEARREKRKTDFLKHNRRTKKQIS